MIPGLSLHRTVTCGFPSLWSREAPSLTPTWTEEECRPSSSPTLSPSTTSVRSSSTSSSSPMKPQRMSTIFAYSRRSKEWSIQSTSTSTSPRSTQTTSGCRSGRTEACMLSWRLTTPSPMLCTCTPLGTANFHIWILHN